MLAKIENVCRDYESSEGVEGGTRGLADSCTNMLISVLRWEIPKRPTRDGQESVSALIRAGLEYGRIQRA